MKVIRRIASIFLALMLVASMSSIAFAAQKGTLTIKGAVSGERYALYKVFDLTQSENNYSYTVNNDFKGYFNEKNISDPVDYIENLNSDSEELSKLAQNIFAWARANNVSPARTVTANSSTVNVSDLEYGYYLLNPLGGSGADNGYATMFSLNTLSGNDTEINIKAVYPTMDKKIVDNEVTNSASVGDDITFKLTSSVPDMTGYNHYYFVFKDTLSKGLTYKEIDSIKVGNKTLTANDYEVKTEVNPDKTTSVKIIFKDFLGNYKNNAGDDIVVKYKATLNDDAVIGGANDNEASLVYSNDPTYDYDGNTGGDPDDPDGDFTAPTGETVKKVTETFTTSLTINKTDGTNSLTGAAFRITGNGVNIVITTGDVFTSDNANGTYWKLKDGTYTTDDPNAGNVDREMYESVTEKYSKKTKAVLDTKDSNVNAEAFVNENGTLTFAGLGAGTYTISEIVAPNGYNSIADFDVTIDFDKDSKKFTAAATGGNTVSVSNNVLSMDVVNRSGTLLPSTGGIGTTIFYLIGAILIAGGGITLYCRRRSNG